MLKIRRSWDRFIVNIEIPVLVRRHLYTETAPRVAIASSTLSTLFKHTLHVYRFCMISRIPIVGRILTILGLHMFDIISWDGISWRFAFMFLNCKWMNRFNWHYWSHSRSAVSMSGVAYCILFYWIYTAMICKTCWLGIESTCTVVISFYLVLRCTFLQPYLSKYANTIFTYQNQHCL